MSVAHSSSSTISHRSVAGSAALMQAAVALNPHLYDWDTTVIPGWSGIFKLDQYGVDLQALNRAIADLRAGNRSAAADDLVDVSVSTAGQMSSIVRPSDLLFTIYYLLFDFARPVRLHQQVEQVSVPAVLNRK